MSPRTLRLSPSLHLQWEEDREPLYAGAYVGNVLGVELEPGMPFAHAVLRSCSLPRGGVVGLVSCVQSPIANPMLTCGRATAQVRLGRMILANAYLAALH